MTESPIKFSVFTKPWRTQSLSELGQFVQQLGFDGIELPVRPGFPVEPENVARDLPRAMMTLREFGVQILSVAGPTDEATLATCAELKIPIIRIMASTGGNGYRVAASQLRRELDALIPRLERYGVTIGIQNHNGRYVCNASGLRGLLEGYDPRHIAAVWDAAHNALQGEEPDLALDIIWPHLAMVNLKNAFWLRANGPEAETAEWKVYWTSGRQGLASWPRVVAELKKRAYQGVVCLTAEYSDEAATDRLIAEDLRYAKSLFSESGA